MSLYPRVKEAFNEGIRYINWGEGDERKKKEEIARKLEYEMDKIGQVITYKLGEAFDALDNTLENSGLDVDSSKRRDIKRKILDNIKSSIN